VHLKSFRNICCTLMVGHVPVPPIPAAGCTTGEAGVLDCSLDVVPGPVGIPGNLASANSCEFPPPAETLDVDVDVERFAGAGLSLLPTS